MESALPLSVPLTVDIKVGDDWEGMTPLTREDAIAAELDEDARWRRHSRRSPARLRRMPELPEVETVARDLRPLITGATIVDATTLWPRTLRGIDAGTFADGSPGGGSRRVGRRGKQLVVELSGDALPDDPPEDDGPAVRRAAGRPRGSVRPARPGPRGRPRDPLPGHPEVRPDRAVPVDRREDPFAKIGPEPLSDDFTVRVFRRRLRARKGRLKPLLLDQSFVAGVGNIYADEALWAARLHPLRTARTLRPPDERRLWIELRRILAEAVIRRGSSIDDYTAPEGDGEMQDHLEVYQRTGEPCLRCGRPIRRIVVGGRATHFCSWCQRLPAGDRAGARAILRTMSAPERVGPALVGAAGRGGERRAGANGDGPHAAVARSRAPKPRTRTSRRPSGRSGPRRPDARRPEPRSAAERVDPPPRARPPRGRDVRHPRRHHGGDRGRRPGRARRAERRRQDDPAPDRRRSRRAGRRRGPPQARR